MKVSVVSYSLSEQPKTLTLWEEKLFSEIEDFIAQGSKIILYPELCLMGLSDYFPGTLAQQYAAISEFTQTLLPKLSRILKGKDVCLCLGSGPRVEDNRIYNSSPIWVSDSWLFQDKIHLTPWETDFTPGDKIQYFNFHKLIFASVICFDIEQPGIALSLKRNGVDVVLVPSATTNKNGNQRVNRCASARSIELGACVITAPLVGDSRCDLIDHSEGRQGFFLPAQEVVIVDQEVYSDYSKEKSVIGTYEVFIELMKELKKKDDETKPYFKEDLIVP